MKKAVFLLVVLFAGIALADVGPSPSYSFSISNANEYSEYDFYYAGNIWPDKLDPVTEETSVYKLNTYITVYALPKGADPVLEAGIASQEIDLQSGHTVFKVASFDESAKQLVLIIDESIKPQSELGFFESIVCFFVQLFGGSC